MGEILGQLGGGAAGGQRGLPGAMTGGQQGAPAQPQQPPAQFGPESLVALLSNLFMGGAQGGPLVQGQAGGNSGALGQASFGALMPLLMQMLQQPQQPSGGGGASSLPGQRRMPTNDLARGGGSPGGPQASAPAGAAAGMLGQLGLV